LLWIDGDEVTTIVPLYSFNNITFKMAAIAAETCWLELHE